MDLLSELWTNLMVPGASIIEKVLRPILIFAFLVLIRADRESARRVVLRDADVCAHRLAHEDTGGAVLGVGPGAGTRRLFHRHVRLRIGPRWMRRDVLELREHPLRRCGDLALELQCCQVILLVAVQPL